MPWIELHQTLPTNKKTMRLCNLLNISKPHAIGCMCLLWLWAIDNAPDGDLSQFSDKEISDVSEWKKKPDVFASALIDSGFLDADKHIHDWYNYAGKLIDRREIQREQSRIRQQRRRDKINSVPVTNADVTRDKRDENVTVTNTPYLTVPNRTVPYLITETTDNSAPVLPVEKVVDKTVENSTIAAPKIYEVTQHFKSHGSQNAFSEAMSFTDYNEDRNWQILKNFTWQQAADNWLKNAK